ncbi:MAG TPA: methyltransferase domain-containing protein [Actinomycetota bacterium]|nr:methyltransferase domain-containing protein [Actinomycetota bacterium]
MTLDDWRSYDSVASLYDRVRAPMHEPPARDLVAAIGIPPGARVLDVGTGPGVAAVAAREAAGPDGLVVGVDPSFEMLRLAAARRFGFVVAAAAIDLPFRDASFDAVVASFVLFFFTRYETAMFDMLRVLRPGGRFGATTWGGGPEDEFRRVWRETAETFVGKDLMRSAAVKAVPWEERFSDPRRLEEALRDAGLRSTRVEHHEYRFTLSQADWLAGRETSAVGRFLRNSLGERLWDVFDERVRSEFHQRFPDPVGDTSDVLIAVGTKPPA